MDLYGRQDSGGRVWFSVSRPSLMDAFGNTSRSMSDEVKNLFADFTTEYRKIHNEVSQKYNTLIVDLNNSMVNGTFKGPYSAYKKEYNRLVAAQKAEFSYRSRNIMGGGVDNLQDIYDALSGGLYRDKGTVTFGHGSTLFLISSRTALQPVQPGGRNDCKLCFFKCYPSRFDCDFQKG